MYKKVFKIKIFGNFLYEIIFNGQKYHFHNFKAGLLPKFVDHLTYLIHVKTEYITMNWTHKYQ